MISNFRLTPPVKQPFASFHLPAANQVVLANQIPCLLVNTGTQEIARLEIVFAINPTKGGHLAGIVAKTLFSGTEKNKSKDILDQLESVGAFHEVTSSSDRLTVTVFVLSRMLYAVLPILEDVLTSAVFPDEEIEIQKRNSIQAIRVNAEKTSIVASQTFRKVLFGEDTPLGKSLKEEDILCVTREECVQFYQENIQNSAFQVCLAGKFSEHEWNDFARIIGTWEIRNEYKGLQSPFLSFNSERGHVTLPKKGAMQASIRVGRPLFDRKDPDYFPFLVTNTALGGYFGSRLMKNIREEKGLTYGISSSLVPSVSFGYWVLGADVKVDLIQVVIDEIYLELQKMQSDMMNEEELSTVKNYMIGSFIGSLNTAFDIADKHKTILFNQLPENYYIEYIANIQEVTPEKIQEMARKYLGKEELFEVLVGSES
ncbi:MAG: M16 family metallopeptidase [Spirosomataceae bacterium]